jgi:hypothetical protein
MQKAALGGLSGDGMNSSQIAGFCVLVGIAGYPALVWIVNKLEERRARKTVRRMRDLN